MTRQEAVDFLLYRPVDFAHLLGFDKLTDLHNDWIINMVRGTEDDTSCIAWIIAVIQSESPQYHRSELRNPLQASSPFP